MQGNHSDCCGVAQHTLILGSSGHVQPNPTEPAQTAHTTIKSDSTQESVKPKSECTAPGASAIKDQDFSGASVIRWTSGHPPIKSVADFLMYLFQDRKLQPGTIDRYRSAIADKLGNSPFNVSKDENPRTSDTSQTGRRCPCIHHPAFLPRISWPKRVQTVWPQWLYQPWLQLWISPSSLLGPCVQSEHCATIWTGHQTSGRTRI